MSKIMDGRGLAALAVLVSGVCVAGAIPHAEATVPAISAFTEPGIGGPITYAASLDMSNDGTWAAVLTITFNTPMAVHTSEADALKEILIKPGVASINTDSSATGSAIEFDGNAVKIFYLPPAEETLRLITENNSSLYVSGTALKSADTGTALAELGQLTKYHNGSRLGDSGTLVKWSGDSAAPRVASASLDRDSRVLYVVSDESLAFGVYPLPGEGSGPRDYGTSLNNATKFSVRDGPSASSGVGMSASNDPSVHRSPVHEVRFALSAQQLAEVAGYSDPHLHVEAAAFDGIGSNFQLDSAAANEEISKQLNYLPGIVSASLSSSLSVAFDEPVEKGTGTFYIRGSVAGSYDPATDVSGTLSVSGSAGSAELTPASLARALAMPSPYLHLEAGAVTDSDGAANVKKSRQLSVAGGLYSAKMDSAGAVSLAFSPDVKTGDADVDQSKIFVRDGPGTSGGTALADSTVSSAGDGATVVVSLTSGQVSTVTGYSEPHVYFEAGAVKNTSGAALGAPASSTQLVSSIFLESASVDLNNYADGSDRRAGKLVLKFSSPVAAGASGADSLSKITIREQDNSPSAELGSAASISFSSGTVTIALSAEQKDAVRAMSGDLEILAGPGAFKSADTSLPLAAVGDGELAVPAGSVTPDTARPVITSVSLDVESGLLTFNFDELVQADPEDVNLSHIQLYLPGTGNFHLGSFLAGDSLSNTCAPAPCSQDGSTVTSSGDSAAVTAQLSEDHRKRAIALSSDPHYWVQHAESVKDTSGNFTPSGVYQRATYTPDTRAPTVHATIAPVLDEGSGTLSVTFSESVKDGPTNVDLANMFVANGPSAGGTALTGSQVTSTVDTDASVTVVLTEELRQAVIGYPAPHLRFGSGAVDDLSGNAMAASASATRIMATDDEEAPVIRSATIDEGTGAWTVTFSEIVSPGSARGTAMYVREAGGGAYNSSKDVPLAVPSLSVSSSGALSEAGRQKVIDMRAPTVYVIKDAVMDISSNGIEAAGTAVSVAPDSAAPAIVSAAATSLNQITVQFSEAVRSSDILGEGWSVSGAGSAQRHVTGSSDISSGSTTVVLTLSGNLPGTAPDGVVLRYETSGTDVGTDDGSGFGALADASSNALAARASISVSDGIAPTFTARATALDQITVAFSEPVTADGTSGAAGWRVSGAGFHVQSRSDISSGSDALVLTLDGNLVMQNLDRVTLTYVPSAGEARDAAGNEIRAATAAVSDGIAPVMLSAVSRDPSLITVSFSESVTGTATGAAATWTLGGADAGGRTVTAYGGASGSDEVRLTVSPAFAEPVGSVTVSYDGSAGDLADAAGTAVASSTIPITAADFAPTILSARAGSPDSIEVTFSDAVYGTATSPADTWVLHGPDASGITVSKYPAPSNSTLVLGLSRELPDTSPDVRLQYVRGPGDVADAAGDQLKSTASPHVRVSDDLDPVLLHASFNEGTGVFSAAFSEAVEISSVNGDNLNIRERGYAYGGVPLSDLLTTASDSATLEFALPDRQRQAVIAMESPQLDVWRWAVRDLAGNPIGIMLDNRIDTRLDVVAPALRGAELNEGTGEIRLDFDERMAEPTAAQAALIRITGSGGAVAFAAADIASARLDPYAPTVITVAVTEAKRQEIIAAGPTAIDVISGGLRDVSGTMASSAGTALDAVFSDILRPSLESSTLDADRGVLVLGFSETMDAASVQNELSKVAVATPDGRVQLSGTAQGQGTRVEVSLASPVFLSLLDSMPDTFVVPRPGTNSTLQAERAPLDLGPISLPVPGTNSTVQAARAQLASGDLYLQVPGADPLFTDTSSNVVKRESVQGRVYVEDGSPPSLVSASVVGPHTVVAQFSEDLDDGTVQPYDFGVSGRTVHSVQESSGAVTIVLRDESPFSPDDTPAVSVEGPVSDTFGNVLEPGPSVLADNSITPVELSRFTASSDGPAKAGDQIDIKLRAQGQILAGASVLLVNGERVPTTGAPGGFDAVYTVPEGAREGPLALSALVFSSAGTPTEFSERDLTGPNAVIDTSPPQVRYATISGVDSFTVTYDEPVTASASDYTGISADGSSPVSALRIEGSGGSNILVTWAGSGSGTVPSTVFFTSGAVADAAGNEASPQWVAVAAARASVDLDSGALPLAKGTVVNEITARPGIEPAIGVSSLTSAVTDARVLAAAGGTAVFDTQLRLITQTPGLPDITLPAGTEVGGLGPLTSGGTTFDEALLVSSSSSTAHLGAEQLRGAYPLLLDGLATTVQVGHPSRDITFSKPVLLEFDSQLSGALVFSVGTDGVPLPIPPCDPSWDAKSLPVGQAVPDGWPQGTYDTDACVDADSDSVWTGHFTVFGVSQRIYGGGSECDDCTPPTLGYDEYGARLVDGGFSYNGLASDVQYFFTPYPLIESEVGRQNSAVLKIYENEGPQNLSHVSLAFGLRSGQVISESLAVINYDISHDGAGTVSVIDPAGAIDLETLGAEHETVECSPGSELLCVRVSISHSFRAPLEFDIVGTDVWDSQRNAWQNYFNHGIRVSGEPLDPQPGTEVNGGQLVLYPISPGSANTDVMADSAGRLYKLSPDGEYRELANQSRLYHAIDESMYLTDGVPMQGYDRSDPLFREYLEAQIRAAQLVADELVPSQYEYPPQAAPEAADQAAADARLRAAVAAEQARALLLFEELFGYQGINDQN